VLIGIRENKARSNIFAIEVMQNGVDENKKRMIFFSCLAFQKVGNYCNLHFVEPAFPDT